MLMIGDPGTGKCVSGDTRVTLADGSEVPIRQLVEDNLDDPKPIDDGVWDDVDFEVPSLQADGTIASQQATKVWKREAPEQFYRIRNVGRSRTRRYPSHPLFVQSEGRFEAVKAEQLVIGQTIACEPISPESTHGQSAVAADGGAVVAQTDEIETIESIEPDDEWVYDLEIDGNTTTSRTASSLTTRKCSYVENIAPRSVYTSGKGRHRPV